MYGWSRSEIYGMNHELSRGEFFGSQLKCGPQGSTTHIVVASPLGEVPSDQLALGIGSWTQASLVPVADLVGVSRPSWKVTHPLEFCETSPTFEVDNIENEAIPRGFLQK